MENNYDSFYPFSAYYHSTSHILIASVNQDNAHKIACNNLFQKCTFYSILSKRPLFKTPTSFIRDDIVLCFRSQLMHFLKYGDICHNWNIAFDGETVVARD